MIDRRTLLKLAGLNAFGIGCATHWTRSAPWLWAASPDAALASPRIRACILIFYYGGPSHLDTFDMKPDAPAEIRGDFQSIATSVPGLRISEHLPHTSKVMHHVALVRSMHHTNRLHDSASIESLTGRQAAQGDREEFSPIPQFYPCYGATVSFQRRRLSIDVPHAALPWVFHNVVDTPCQGGGFLGTAYDPFQIDGNPQTNSYRASAFVRPPGLPMSRVADRRDLLNRLNQNHRLASDDRPQQWRAFKEKAFDLMQSERLHEALDIERESAANRRQYGLEEYSEGGGGTGAEKAYGRNLRGQNLLLARRLVEAGVPFVNVYDFRQQGQNWDSHNDNFKQHKEFLLPAADRAYAALIQDLDERGLLDSTLVIGMGEFGRTPKINANAGRDHWPDCYSITLAGGGVKGGYIFGASDKHGAYPVENPVTPGDLAATIYGCFGLNPAAEIRDQTGRPHRLADGKPIEELFV